MNIKVKIEGVTGEVPREKYVKAKCKQLREFGYGNLTPLEVDEQITALLDRKEVGKGLTVIGVFMEEEVIVPEPFRSGIKTSKKSK
jgi:hypothetical protein